MNGDCDIRGKRGGQPALCSRRRPHLAGFNNRVLVVNAAVVLLTTKYHGSSRRASAAMQPRPENHDWKNSSNPVRKENRRQTTDRDLDDLDTAFVVVRRRARTVADRSHPENKCANTRAIQTPAGKHDLEDRAADLM